MLRSISISVAVLATLAHVRPAEACSPPLPGFYATVPPTGARIPQNAVIALQGWGQAQVTVSQFDVVFVVAPEYRDGMILVPLEGLGLSGEITLFATADEPEAQSVQSTYFVVPEDDVTPPQFEGLKDITFEWFEDEPGLCQQGGFHVLATVPAASDDWGVTSYILRELLPNDAIVHAGTAFHYGADEIQIPAYAGYDEGQRCYTAFAMDVAANESPEFGFGDIFCVDLTRETTMPDAGLIDSGDPDTGVIDDAGPKADGGTTADGGVKTKPDAGNSGGSNLSLDREGGCGCSSHRTSPTSGVWTGLFLGLIFLVRRKTN